MKLTLIQSGGFTGKSKIAEEDLSAHPEVLQQFVKKIFSEKPVQTQPATTDQSRDKESYSLEFNGAQLPLNSIVQNDDLQKLIKKMKGNLKFKKS